MNKTEGTFEQWFKEAKDCAEQRLGIIVTLEKIDSPNTLLGLPIEEWRKWYKNGKYVSTAVTKATALYRKAKRAQAHQQKDKP